MTLTEFLLARIAEDEAVARAATSGPWTHAHEGLQGGEVVRRADARVARVYKSNWPDYLPDCENAAHIARHDPARVIADCEARREIIAFRPHDSDSPYRNFAISTMAAVYADHPDYRQEW